MYLRPVYTGEQVNSMVKQEKRQFARCMARLLVTMLKANAHKETNNKKKGTKGRSTQRWQPTFSTSTPQEPFQLPDLGIKSPRGTLPSK